MCVKARSLLSSTISYQELFQLSHVSQDILQSRIIIFPPYQDTFEEQLQPSMKHQKISSRPLGSTNEWNSYIDVNFVRLQYLVAINVYYSSWVTRSGWILLKLKSYELGWRVVRERVDNKTWHDQCWHVHSRSQAENIRTSVVIWNIIILGHTVLTGKSHAKPVKDSHLG